MQLPPLLVSLLEKLRSQSSAADPAQPPSDDPGPAAGDGAGEESLLDRYMPSPQAAAVAVMALLAAGVVLGAVTDPFAQSASSPTILVSAPSAEAEEAEEAPEVETEYVTEGGTAAPPAAEAPSALPEETFEEPLEEPGGANEEIELPPEEVLPPVTHMFTIVLRDQGFEALFGTHSTAPYLAKTLAAKGEVLENYYAVTQGDLANEIALLSGQGPTAQTAAGCPEYEDVSPGTIDPSTTGTTEQVEGTGCVYPVSTLTLPGQLNAATQTWEAYVEEGAPSACGAGGAAVAYFHSLLDGGECASSTASIDQLATDLGASTEVPALSYIVPGPCHDGSETPCRPGAPAGLPAAEAFLKEVIPEIEASASFKVGGMIAITSAEAPQSGPAADSSACCATPEYPNLKAAGASPLPPASGPVRDSGGGGRVGMLLLSPYVLPGSVNESEYFNHFSFLRSVEELFGLSALGYAADPAVAPFTEAVYNNLES
jgi:phosphatidylinositol-3-phosphatase